MSIPPLLATLLESLAQGEAVARVVITEGEGQGRWALVRAADAPGWAALGLAPALLAEAQAALQRRRHTTLHDGARTLWVEVIGAPPTLVIVGAGHIAEPLATLGHLCDFRVIVVDDRPQYANPARFPQAEQVIAAPFTEALRALPLDPDSYLVLVTRGHAHDVACLLELLDRPHAYLGMVGSKRRVQAVWQLLEAQQGIERARLCHVFAPIGLDIGAESPAEIAVAIMGEITLLRRGGSGQPLSEALRERGARVHLGRTGKGRS